MRSAQAYQALMPYRYLFSLGFKGKLQVVTVEFPQDGFYHLAGFHKAGLSLASRKQALTEVLQGALTAARFSAGGYAPADRWTAICGLQEMIEANRAVFRYRGHEQQWSRIEADYLLAAEDAFLFIDDGKPVSIFGRSERAYELGCPKLKTLMIRRETIATGCMETVFRSPSFRE